MISKFELLQSSNKKQVKLAKEGNNNKFNCDAVRVNLSYFVLAILIHLLANSKLD